MLADFHELYPKNADFDGLFVLFPYAHIAGRASSVLERISDSKLKDELAAFAGEEDAQA